MDIGKVINEAIANQESSEYIVWLESLKDEYAPDVIMNQSEYGMFSYYLDSYTFEAFLESIHRMDTAMLFGVGTEVYFEDLTEEDLMSAWLNPNSIQIIDEE